MPPFARPARLPQPFPPLKFATLVANAVKHGVAPASDGGAIAVTVRRIGSLLEAVYGERADVQTAALAGPQTLGYFALAFFTKSLVHTAARSNFTSLSVSSTLCSARSAVAAPASGIMPSGDSAPLQARKASM